MNRLCRAAALALLLASGLAGCGAPNVEQDTVADIEMFAAWQHVNNNSTLSPAEKLERIAQISQRASRLELRLKQEPSLR